MLKWTYIKKCCSAFLIVRKVGSGSQVSSIMLFWYSEHNQYQCSFSCLDWRTGSKQYQNPSKIVPEGAVEAKEEVQAGGSRIWPIWGQIWTHNTKINTAYKKLPKEQPKLLIRSHKSYHHFIYHFQGLNNPPYLHNKESVYLSPHYHRAIMQYQYINHINK